MSKAFADQAKQVQKVYIEWCVKAAEIILDSRLDPEDALENTVQAQASASFNLKVPELWNVRGEAIARPEFFQVKSQRSFQIEILHNADDTDGNSLATTDAQGADAYTGSDDEEGKLLERWTFSFFPAMPETGLNDSRCNQMLVKKLSVTLRSLLCFTRLLPAFAICRGPRPVSGRRRYRFRIEASGLAASRPQPQELKTEDFVSLQSSLGTLRLSVSHRKDLTSLQRGLDLGSTIDEIEVEEGYVAGTPRAGASAAIGGLEAGTALGRLGKIAEEPEGKPLSGSIVLGPVLKATDSGDHPQASTTASSGYGEATTAPLTRGRVGSADSEASSMSHASTSSRGQSMPDHAVVLGSTPPLAAAMQGANLPPGLISLGPGSPSSSRSATPHTTPQLKPQSSPPGFADLGSAALGPSQQASPSSSLYAATHSSGSAPSAGLVAAAQRGGALASNCAPPNRPGAFEDLSDLWMNPPPAWTGRRRGMSHGSQSRGSRGSGSPGSGPASRSLSPEDPNRGSGRLEGRLDPLAPAADFRLMGYDDDEEPHQQHLSDDDSVDSDAEHNVVASTLQGSNAGAFVVSSGSPLSFEQLGIAAALLEGAAQKPHEGGGLGLSSPGSKTGSMHGSPRTFSSPLIATLNPFLSPPPLELPGPDATGLGQSAGSSGRRGYPEAAASTGHSARSQEAAKPSASLAAIVGGLSRATEDVASGGAIAVEQASAESAAQHLLVEMGDLVCKLQQRKDLVLTMQEVPVEDLLSRLAHFRDLAEGAELRSNLYPA